MTLNLIVIWNKTIGKSRNDSLVGKSEGYQSSGDEFELRLDRLIFAKAASEMYWIGDRLGAGGRGFDPLPAVQIVVMAFSS